MEEGIVTNALLFPNLLDSPRAAELAHRKNLSVGLLLNLTEGSALSAEEDISSLLDANGYFLTLPRLLSALAEGLIEQVHVEREVRAQLEWFLDRVGSPSHVASQQHIHCHPVLSAIIAQILSRYGIRFVRIPHEKIEANDPWDFSPERSERIQTINAWALHAKKIYDAADIGHTEHFLGHAMEGNANARRLRSLISKLEDSTTELMVHPGQCDPSGEAFDRDPQRETERNMLLDPEMRAHLKSRGVELVSYHEC